jgi:Rrf2 family protein
MRLSTMVRYGARVLTELGLAYPDGLVSVRELAERQRISGKYIEHILKSLRTAGIVRAARGSRGGYSLARAPEAITLKDVYETLVGSLAPVECVDCPDSCSMHDTCPTRETWVELKDAVEQVLGRTRLLDLVEQKKRRTLSSPLMYHI